MLNPLIIKKTGEIAYKLTKNKLNMCVNKCFKKTFHIIEWPTLDFLLRSVHWHQIKTCPL